MVVVTNGNTAGVLILILTPVGVQLLSGAGLNLTSLVDGVSVTLPLPADRPTSRRVGSFHQPKLYGSDTIEVVRSNGTDAMVPANGVTPSPVLDLYVRRNRDREIAVHLAPTFYQALGPIPRFDYITRFDFDADWLGDNNWHNAANRMLPLPAYLYYAVSETQTHFFVVYAVFHPRDYKGGNKRGAILSEVLQYGVKLVGYFDFFELIQGAVLAHENDLEGVMVVGEKKGPSLRDVRVVRMETLAHNEFLKYEFAGLKKVDMGPMRLKGESVELFIEPKGHGIMAYRGGTNQLEAAENGFVVYRYGGSAEEPESLRRATVSNLREDVGYDLVSLYDTLWARAQDGENETFGDEHDFTMFSVRMLLPSGDDVGIEARPGRVGASLRGEIGGRNMARSPWSWFDRRERERALGEWFFDPAETISRHFNPDEPFSLVYIHHPYIGIFGPSTPDAFWEDSRMPGVPD